MKTVMCGGLGTPTLKGCLSKKVSSVISDTSHPGHSLFDLLSSGRLTQSCKNSLNFIVLVSTTIKIFLFQDYSISVLLI